MATPGFQFVHIESYARKADSKGRSVGYVLDEVERRPDACLHVAAPRPPELVHGLPLDQLRALHDARADEARTVVAGGRSRKIRNDQHSLLTVMASHPALSAAVRQDADLAADVDRWERTVVAWLHAQWGDDLATVIRHVDEAHVHLHAYIVPSDGAMRARRLHPGHAAKEAAKAGHVAAGRDAKMANAIGDRAYVEAMRELQNGFHRMVGAPCGLARLGPGRRRLSRAEWHAERAAARAAADAMEAAARMQAVAETARDDAVVAVAVAEERAADADARQAQADAARARAGAAVAAARETAQRASVVAAAADRRREAAEQHVAELRQRAKAVVAQARHEARQLVEQATKEADRLRRRAQVFGAWIGGWLQGFRGASADAVAVEVAARVRTEERRAAATMVAEAREEASEARKALQHTEDRLAAASASVVALGRQRDRLARQLDRIAPTPAAAAAPAMTYNRRGSA